MAIKITTPTNGGDSINFGSGVTAIAAEVTGSEVSSGEGKLEFKTTTGGTSATKVTVLANGDVGIGTTSPESRLEIKGTYADAKLHIHNQFNGPTSFDGSGAGLLLTATGMNTTAKYTPAIQFGSTDTSFTTTNPKIGAAINGVSTESYTADDKGAMDLAFYTTPNTPGTGQTITEQMRLNKNGDLKFNSGYGSAVVAYGCRAWVNFNGTGTVAIRESGNVSSITDNGVGSYDVNFTVAMVDANYVCNVNASTTTETGNLNPPAGVNKTTAKVRIDVETPGGSQYNAAQIDVTIIR